MKRSLLLVVMILTLLLPHQAQAAKGIGLSPALQELELAEGQDTVSFELTVANSTDAVAELKLSLLDFGSLDESGGVAFLGRTGQETGDFGLRQWMSLSQDNLRLEPGQTSQVEVIIKNEQSLSPGGHYGAVVVSASGQASANSESVSVLPAASTLVLLKKLGGEVQELSIESLKTSSSLINLPKSANLRFNNTGNTHLVPRGTVDLISPTGSLVSRGIINETSAYILPGSFRQYETSLQNYSQPWLPGRYKLVTTYRFDGTSNTETYEKTYWYAGKLLIYGLITACLLIVLYLYIRNRRRPPTRN